MLESGLSGSVRGVPSNGHPYRDPGPIPDEAHEVPLPPLSVELAPLGPPVAMRSFASILTAARSAPAWASD
jgi:hypothetical protein